MLIREMVPEDAGEVYRITCASLDQYFNPNMFTFFRAQWPSGQLVAADLTGRPVGYICGSRSGIAKVNISMFAVSEGYRSKGIGGMLLEAFRSRAALEGAVTVTLEVRPSNEGALRFYKRHGFAVAEYLPRFYNDNGDAVRMVGGVQSGNRGAQLNI
ncbi:MAG: N-acetyltransferase [Candidatus Methanomethylophilaceae archaeon]|jgi:ribosomal-protein-alanine N-acetyltransferase|nr:N-acetyltransferase [Candidatus Methanomethylophilaceae archaeon]NLF34174.1 GNAT family N-acetyltransferase [Thermoplasmatales archaeon]